MTDLLERANDWLQRMRHEYLTTSVTYRRGTQTLTLWATFGRTTFEAIDDAGATVAGHVWDFLVLATEVPGGEPCIGDEIIANGVRFEVLPHGEDTQGYRWSDAFRRTYRIHTRQTGVI